MLMFIKNIKILNKMDFYSFIRQVKQIINEKK
jgi:hypothetical protein